MKGGSDYIKNASYNAVIYVAIANNEDLMILNSVAHSFNFTESTAYRANSLYVFILDDVKGRLLNNFILELSGGFNNITIYSSKK